MSMSLWSDISMMSGSLCCFYLRIHTIHTSVKDSLRNICRLLVFVYPIFAVNLLTLRQVTPTNHDDLCLQALVFFQLQSYICNLNILEY